MPKAASKFKVEEPWFGSFTPAGVEPLPPALVPAEAPLPAPEALSSVPNTYPAGQTYEGFLYGLISSQIDASLTYTRGYLSDTPNGASGMRGWHIDKLDDAQATSHGISFDVEGVCRWETGVDYDTAASGRADFVPVFDPSNVANEVQLVTVGTNTAGQFKLTFAGQQTADIAFNASAATVESALEALSNLDIADVAVEGNAGGPWLVTFGGVYAATNVSEMTLANGTTPLSGGSGQGVSTVYPGGTGADLMRWSSYADGSGVQAPKLQIGAPAGTARAQSEFIMINAPAGLSALSCRFKDNAGLVNGLNFVNQSVTKKRAIINLQNCWQMGVDYQNADAEHFSLVDSNRPGGALTRLQINGDGGLTNLAGVNTNNPLASWHIGGSNDSTFYDVIQTHLAAGYSTLNNRMIQLQAILDASQTVNYVWLMGTLGANSTRVTPTASSVGPVSHGIESTNAIMSLVSAPSGTNQTISRVVEVGNNTLGFFDLASPVAKQAGASAAAIAAITDANAKSAVTALQAALAAYNLVTSPA